MNPKLLTITLLFFLILCISATWGKIKEWLFDLPTWKSFLVIIAAYLFFDLILYNFNPLYPLYFLLLTAGALMVFFIVGIYRFLIELIE
jgi:hypothetical protein